MQAARDDLVAAEGLAPNAFLREAIRMERMEVRMGSYWHGNGKGRNAFFCRHGGAHGLIMLYGVVDA